MDQDNPGGSGGCGGVGGGGGDVSLLSPVLAGLLGVGAGVAGSVGAEFWSLADAELREAVRVGFVMVQQAQAVFLRAVAELDGRPGVVPGADPPAVARTFLVHALRRTPGQAGADVRAAAALSPDADAAAGGLPRLGAALAAGEVSREHAGVAVSAMNRLPRRFLREPLTDDDLAGFGVTPQENAAAVRPLVCRGDLIDQLVTQHAVGYDSGTADRLARYLLEAADPDGAGLFDPEAVTRRGLRMTTDRTGMLLLRGELDPETAAWVRAAVEAFSAPDPARSEPRRTARRFRSVTGGPRRSGGLMRWG